MEERNRFIDPKRYGIWISVSFGLALLALLTAILGTREGRVGSLVAQTEVIKLNERIVALERKQAAPAVPAPTAAAPAK